MLKDKLCKLKSAGKLQFLRSLKIRIFIIMLIVGLIPSIAMRYAILQNYEQRAVSVRTSDISTQLKILANHLLTSHYLQEPSSEVINAELDQLSGLYDGRVIVINSGLRIVKDTYGISEGKTMISEEVIRTVKGQSESRYDQKNGYIEMTVPIIETVMVDDEENMNGQLDEYKDVVVGVILVSASTDSIVATMDILSRKAMIVEAIVIVFIIILAALLAKLLFKPFEKITEALNEVQEGYTSDPIAVKDCLETERIGEAFNRVLGRMKLLDDSRKEFVSNVSHELRTPITSIKVLADSLITQENAPIELYQEFMEDIVKEIDREDKIINDLLALVKMDRKAADINIVQSDINVLVEQILKRLRPIAIKNNIELIYESVRPVTAAVDEVKLSLAITNLVENAIKYNKTQGWVKVSLDADYQCFTIVVEDSGLGIPEESLEHIYERFYRVDKSRSREIGGTGLGLAITKSAILMHRGSIRAVSEQGVGTTFTVKIPLTYIAPQS